MFQLCLGLNSESVGSNPLYKELVESLSKPTTLKQDEKNRAETLVELLKMERDAKRRRISYKNRVHTKNKSHIEILREVLAEQMSTLSQHAEMENALEAAQEDESGKMKSSEELVEIRFPDGNPHLAWKKVLKMKSQPHIESESEKEVGFISDERNNERSVYSDGARFKEKKKEFNRKRSKYYNEGSSYSKYVNSKPNDMDSKHSHSKYDEGQSDFVQRSSMKMSDSKYQSFRHEDKIKYGHRQKISKRDLERSHSSYERDNDKYYSQRHDSRHSDSDDCSSKRRDYSPFHDEDYRKSKKRKRHHSNSSSPSDGYKSRKRKSKHKKH